MKKSDEKESRDAVIFILAIIFLVVVLVSLGASFITYNVMRREVKEIVANDQLSEAELQSISQTAALYTRKILKEEDSKPGVKANELSIVSEGVSADENIIAGVVPADGLAGHDVTTDLDDTLDDEPSSKKPSKKTNDASGDEKDGPTGAVVQQVSNDVDEEGIIDRAIDKIKSAIEDKIGSDKYRELVKTQDDRTNEQEKRNADQDAKNDAQDKRNADQDARNDAQEKRNADQDAKNDAQDKWNKNQDERNAAQDEYNTYNTTIINKLSERVQIVNKSQAQSVNVNEGILYFYTE